MGFKDVLRRSFLEGVNVVAFSITSMTVTIAITAALGIYISCIPLRSRKAF